MKIMEEDIDNLVFIVDKNCDRLEDYLLSKNISGRYFRKTYKNKDISVNGKFRRKDLPVQVGEVIRLKIEEETHDIEPEKMDLDIVYEDCDVIVLNKEPNMVVHPTKSHLNGTLSNGVSYHFKEIGLERKIRLVNRLDMDTSGLLIVAKNPYAHQQLSLQLENDMVKRRYKLLVDGLVEKDEDIIEVPIGREEEGSIRKMVLETGQYAKTRYEVLERFKDISLVEAELFTGRSHQIRVHMEYIGHPIVGDHLYGKQDGKLNRQALHSYYLKFKQPRTDEDIELEVGLPSDILELMKNS